MIAFGQPDPDSPVYEEYCASVARTKQMLREQNERRAELLREMEEGIKKAESDINKNVAAFLAALIIPAALWLLAYLWLFGE